MNRKSYLFVLIIIIAFSLIAMPALAKNKVKGAVSKGNLLLGGGLDASFAGGSDKYEPDEGDDITEDISEIGLEGLCGYFVMRGLEVGGLLDVNRDKSDEDDTETVKSEWAIGPQVGYFHPINKSFSVFGLGVLGYMKTTDTTETKHNNKTVKTETTASGFYFEPRGGVVIHLTRSLGLYGSLFFNYGKGSGERDHEGETNDFDIVRTRYGLKIGILGFLDI